MVILLGGCDAHLFGGGDDEPPPDGTKPSGLTIEWESRPETIPGQSSSGIRIEAAVFRLANLRVVGDAGPLALGELALEWSTDRSPTDLILADAPSGLYSRCLFDLVSPGDFAYEVTGTVDEDEQATPFTIRDRETASISIDYSIMLAAGGEATVPITVEIDELVNAVDFTQVPKQAGQLIIEDGSPQLARVRLELARAFSVEQ